MGMEKEKLKSFAVVEMMGHRKIVGLVTESDISGGQLLRVDVLNSAGEPERTEYIGVGSIYCLTIVSEEAAKIVAVQNAPRPAWAWIYRNKRSFNPAMNRRVMPILMMMILGNFNIRERPLLRKAVRSKSAGGFAEGSNYNR